MPISTILKKRLHSLLFVEDLLMNRQKPLLCRIKDFNVTGGTKSPKTKYSSYGTVRWNITNNIVAHHVNAAIDSEAAVAFLQRFHHDLDFFLFADI